MKKLILIIVFGVLSISSFSQQESQFRVGMDVGYTFVKDGLGLSLMLEPKYVVNKDLNIGLRVAGSAIIRDADFFIFVPIQTTETYVYSFLGTCDYYFSKGTSFVPFVGGGIGFASALSLINENEENELVRDLQFKGGLAGVLRGGFEWGKFRMGLEYNLVPKTPLYLESGITTTDISNSYFAITLGFYVGGGKWGK